MQFECSFSPIVVQEFAVQVRAGYFLLIGTASRRFCRRRAPCTCPGDSANIRPPELPVHARKFRSGCRALWGSQGIDGAGRGGTRNTEQLGNALFRITMVGHYAELNPEHGTDF